MGKLPEALEKARVHIEKLAKDYGLDFYPVVFEMVTGEQMNAFAAYGGFPTRYPHWSFGMQYEQLSKGYQYGLSKIYEMVVNTDPVYAYLMEGNLNVDQKMVMAHVFGHADFFKHNKWYEPTNKKMMDTCANHATRVRTYIEKHGKDRVEAFIDKCLSVDNLIDRYAPYSGNAAENIRKEERKRVAEARKVAAYKGEYLESMRPELASEKEAESDFVYPERPQRDVLAFLIDYAPLENWQADILNIIREEAYYFSPQGMTKVMNEGWASYWHTTMMTRDILDDSEFVCYADHHAGAVAMHPNGFNPYKIGLELFRDIEERWDKGRFGREWDACDNYEERKNWNKQTGLGRKKIFEVRRDYNDITFIEEFLTEDFAVRNNMFIYKQDENTGQWVKDISEFPKHKKKLLFQLTNFGQPIIEVINGNHNNNGELLLRHIHEGVDMQPDKMKESMEAVAYLWGRPVCIDTKMDDEDCIFRWDGKEHTKESKK